MNKNNPLPTPHKARENRKRDDGFLGISRQIAELLSRLRMLEERYANLRREHQVTSHNMIEHHQNIAKQLRKLNDSHANIKRELSLVKEQIGAMAAELSASAKVHDVKSLERYIDMWQPLDFISRQEAEKLIEEALRSLSSSKSKSSKSL